MRISLFIASVNISTIPSSIQAVPNIIPERMQSDVFDEITFFGAFISTDDSNAP